MADDVAGRFEQELQSRGLSFSIDEESGRHVLEIGGRRMLVSLENLRRDVARDGDHGRIARFVDTIESSVGDTPAQFSKSQLFWSLEPSDYVETPDFRVSISDVVDRVLVHVSPSLSLITWMTPGILQQLELSESDAGKFAFDNLAREMNAAKVESNEIDGVKLIYLDTPFPIKASLLLAPNFAQVVELGEDHPILAVVPCRDFLYAWSAAHQEFVNRVGPVVVGEYQASSYPISCEVFQLTERHLKAIGSFTIPDKS